MAEVRWTERALADLHGIYEFIARDSPRSAEAQADRLLATTERLASFPDSGRIVPEFPERGYREVVTGNYRVLYRHEGDHVWIAAVVHGRRVLGDPSGT